MAHEHIQRLKAENTAMSALLKRATGEPLNDAEREYVAETAKSHALENRLREKYDLSGAISKALRSAGKPVNLLPPQSADVTKSAEGDTIEAAIAKSFAGTKTSLTLDPHIGPDIVTAAQTLMTRERDAAAAEAVAKSKRPKISNVRADITGQPRSES